MTKCIITSFSIASSIVNLDEFVLLYTSSTKSLPVPLRNTLIISSLLVSANSNNLSEVEGVAPNFA